MISPHILLVIDGAESLFRPSRYLDENVQTIPVNKLGVPGLLFDYATGSKKLAKGSVIMAADGTADLLRLPGETGRLCVDKLTKTEAAGLFANLAETQMLNTGDSDTLAVLCILRLIVFCTFRSDRCFFYGSICRKRR